MEVNWVQMYEDDNGHSFIWLELANKLRQTDILSAAYVTVGSAVREVEREALVRRAYTNIDVLCMPYTGFHCMKGNT